MSKLDQVIKRCGGGNVNFGLTGQSPSIYSSKFMLCVSAFQDQRYGAGMRVHNPCNKDGKIGYRCTVCGAGNGICRL